MGTGEGRYYLIRNLPSVRGRLADELCFHVKHGARRNRQKLVGIHSFPCTQSLPVWGKDLTYSLAILLGFRPIRERSKSNTPINLG
jgi:hypothetical protein